MNWLAGEATTIALCWRIERRDGVAIGLTAHDRDLTVDGIVHRAAPGMVPSAVRRQVGLSADTMEVAGALAGDAIDARDLAAGRWDGAAVRLFAIDWTDPTGPAVPLARGELGDVEVRDGRFSAELRGPTALLERPVVEQTSPECRAELGDRRCRVDMAARRHVRRIAAVPEAVTILIEAGVAGDCGYGRLRWIDGPNGGLASAILTGDGTTIILRDPPPFAARAGDHVEIGEGCDKAFATCRDRFANAANFRGEPHLAGNDLLTRYPGA